ncbi:hypothetical protein [Ligilactobacillus equi]|uniref:Uncharacterized protein n=1 Tax=Ligilactobacillus equi DPC 6820 TaxID=1392007 RepID=V7HUD4_9LACO|nr:hypothetical protein [Ligilactobacillus equi]ETA73517.1 hypothetical protein LEQ_1212 [Ligilactobacillus equi DPC 6820]
MDHKIVITKNGEKTRIKIRTSQEVSNDIEQDILDAGVLNSLGEAIKEILKRKAKKGDNRIEVVTGPYLSILSHHLTDDLHKSSATLLVALGEVMLKSRLNPQSVKAVLEEFYSDYLKDYNKEEK